MKRLPQYSRRLTGRRRTRAANRALGLALAFVAGAINAGGFLAVHQYTSHMTGIVSAMADNLALGLHGAALAGLSVLLAFLLGAVCTSCMVNWARRHRLWALYAAPLLLEATLLLVFGLLGAQLAAMEGWYVSLTVLLLGFLMGLQNAVITQASHFEIRTTHVTGLVTDLGIELGKLLSSAPVAAGAPLGPPVRANWGRLRLLSGLLTCFFGGGVLGALGFQHWGYVATVPLAVLLLALAWTPALDDVALQWRRHRARQL